MIRYMTKMETEVYQAMTMMDVESGKILIYRQLMQHPTCRGKWQVSSTNEFGRLANRVWDGIKGTHTIKFIRMQDAPKDRLKDVIYGQFVCMVWPEGAE